MARGPTSEDDDPADYTNGGLPRFISSPPWSHPNGLIDLRLSSAIQRHMALALRYTNGNLMWAAQEMGLNVSTLHRWRSALADGRGLGYGERELPSAKRYRKLKAVPRTIVRKRADPERALRSRGGRSS